MMSRYRLLRMMAALTIACAASAAVLHATERRPLPALQLRSLDAQPVQTADIARQGHWLLIYVEPSCGACVEVLSAMTAEEYPGYAQRVTVIVGGATYEQAQQLAAASELGAAQWVLDPDKSAREALGIRQVPMTIGIRNSTIEWGLSGALRKSVEMTSVLASWLKRNSP